ncbi:hypothetical protein ACFL6I_08665 [candidate division KSB1 bacterium]
MKKYPHDGKVYRIPNKLNDFQLELYIHLINYKWAQGDKEPGIFKNSEYDAMFPNNFDIHKLPIIYDEIRDIFIKHQKSCGFKLHKFVKHMASSQAACANLFIPILKNRQFASQILKSIKPDLKEIAFDYNPEIFDFGFRIEYSGEPEDTKNLLNDKTKAAGTDSDIAIAYYDKDHKLNLWLIEHKLSEKEFTSCGGYKSTNNRSKYKCKSISMTLDDSKNCYYHINCGYKYWDITKKHPEIFLLDNLRENGICPFKGGLNQLWRNQILATAIEKSESPNLPFKKVFFSVVHHPQNTYLEKSISKFKKLINNNDRFFTFTSDVIINEAQKIDEPELRRWTDWYKELYMI